MSREAKVKKRIRNLWLNAFTSSLAIAGALSFVWVLTHTFILAFLSPSKTVLICIDKFGEAWPELPMVIYIAISSSYVLLKLEIKEVKLFKRRRRRLEKRLKKARLEDAGYKEEKEEDTIRFIIDEEETKKLESKNEPFQCPQCHSIFQVKPVKKPARVTCPYCKLHGIIE